MLETFIENDDELGLVLGHEVSHLICGHNSERTSLIASLETLEVLLLSLDPTEGLLSILILAALRLAREVIVASHSRHTEMEADELGIVLAARACFDTKIAPRVFKKMHQQHLELNNDNVEVIEERNTLLTLKDEVEVDSEDDVSKENDEKEEYNSGGGLTSFIQTHPPSMERFLYLQAASLEENPDKYSDCADIKKKFFTALKFR